MQGRNSTVFNIALNLEVITYLFDCFHCCKITRVVASFGTRVPDCRIIGTIFQGLKILLPAGDWVSTFILLVAFNEDLDFSDHARVGLRVFIKDGLQHLRFIEMRDKMVLRTYQMFKALAILSLDEELDQFIKVARLPSEGPVPESFEHLEFFLDDTGAKWSHLHLKQEVYVFIYMRGVLQLKLFIAQVSAWHDAKIFVFQQPQRNAVGP